MSFGAVGLSNVYNCKHQDVTTTSSISSIIPVYSQICETAGRIFLVAWQWIDWLTDTVFCYRLVTTSHTARRKFARQRGIRCWHTTSPMPSFCVQYLGHVQLPRRMLKYATVDGAYHPLPRNRVYSSITYCMNYTFVLVPPQFTLITCITKFPHVKGHWRLQSILWRVSMQKQSDYLWSHSAVKHV